MTTETNDTPATFVIGDRVEKVKGANWRGRVVGTYSTSLTPEGYAVESENEPGSVQIYPAASLRSVLAADTAPGWEFFRDAAYFDMWSVRRIDQRGFEQAFHVSSEEEAHALMRILSASTEPPARHRIAAERAEPLITPSEPMQLSAVLNQAESANLVKDETVSR